MPANSTRAVTLKQVAARAGLSLATVSYAMRQHPKISAATRAKVLQAATAIGYRPDPRIASLMSYIRGAQPSVDREQLAFVWVHTTRREARQNPFLRKIFAGALARANQAGFALEEFWTDDAGVTDRRLEQILRARGIVGVVLSPVTTAEHALTLNWDWGHFSLAVIGNVSWDPELNHAGHHHYLGMRLTLLELRKLGCMRPAALVEHKSNERSKRAWVAAFLTNHTDPAAAADLIRVWNPDQPASLSQWLLATRADALIVSECALLRLPGLKPAARKLGAKIVTLYWSDDLPAAIGGIDQCYDRIAAHAVDLVAAQLNANETGVPDLPRIMLFPGRWVPPAGERFH